MSFLVFLLVCSSVCLTQTTAISQRRLNDLPELPSAPYNLVVSYIKARSALLQFSVGFDGHSPITNWTVEAKEGNNASSYQAIYQISDPSARSIQVQNLWPYTTYHLRLIAENIVGRSSASVPTRPFQTLQDAPAVLPGNVTARALNATALIVSWKKLTGREWCGVPRGYKIIYKMIGEPYHFLKLTGSNRNSIVLTGLREMTEYQITVQAYNDYGETDYSRILVARTGQSGTTGSVPGQMTNGGNPVIDGRRRRFILDNVTVTNATHPTPNPPTQVYVRLVHGHSCHEGRVELFAFNNWGTVCSDAWSDNDASVVCGMLGYPRANASARINDNGLGSGVILLDNVQCNGTENSIADCPANKWGDHDCTHFQDAGVSCDNSSRPDGFILISDTYNHLIYRMNLDTGNYVIVPLRQSGSPFSVDYDPVEARVYWNDVAYNTIYSIEINAHSQKTVKITGTNSRVEGIAVDFMSRLLFYTDSGNDNIVMLTLDGTQEKIVVNSSLSEPKAIELDSINGLLFWTNWGIQPTIEKSNYDGSNRQVIINSGLGFPNGLAVDTQRGRIFWADARNDKIETSYLDGSNRHTVYEEPLSNIVGLSYFQEHLYYTDWHKSTVMKVPVTGGVSQAIGPPGFGRLNDIHVHKDGAGPLGTNACSRNNGGCSEICIPTTGGSNKCI